MPIGICSAPTYIPIDLPFLIQCGINAPYILLKSAWRDIFPYPISWRLRHGWSTQPTPPVGAFGVKSDSQGLALIPLVTGPLPFSQKTCLLGCAAPPLIFPWTFPFLSNVRLMHPAYYLKVLGVTFDTTFILTGNALVIALPSSAIKLINQLLFSSTSFSSSLTVVAPTATTTNFSLTPCTRCFLFLYSGSSLVSAYALSIDPYLVFSLALRVQS